MHRAIQATILAAVLASSAPASAACIVCIDTHPGYEPNWRLFHDGKEWKPRRAIHPSRPQRRDYSILESVAADRRRLDNERSPTCRAYRVIYLRSHPLGRSVPRSLRNLHGCERWRKDASYHLKGRELSSDLIKLYRNGLIGGNIKIS